jgi:hypothetical protein
MKIKNWSKFQHFKDRRPPWIKLYRDLLDDMEWHDLDPLSSKVLVTLWLLASEDDKQQGKLPNIKTLSWRLRLPQEQVLDCINKLSHWLEQDDINLISTGYQDDLPETETERETKKETEIISPPAGEPESKIPDCKHSEVISLYHQHLPTLRKVEVWNAARQGYLRQRWREVAEELSKSQAIDSSNVLGWWGEFFQHVGKSKFLTGKVNSKDGRAFTADLEWILKPSNFAKIVEGKYHGTN